MLPILLIWNYIKCKHLTIGNQRKGKIRNTSSSGAEFRLTGAVLNTVAGWKSKLILIEECFFSLKHDLLKELSQILWGNFQQI